MKTKYLFMGSKWRMGIRGESWLTSGECDAVFLVLTLSLIEILEIVEILVKGIKNYYYSMMIVYLWLASTFQITKGHETPLALFI